MSINAYPLCWPQGWPRTPSLQQERSRFSTTPDRARRGLLKEIERLVGRWYRRDDVIISTDIKLRLDGEPYASQRSPDDKGVAVYFMFKKKQMVFACDRYDLIHDNIHAIAKTIEALRGIERWGASDMLERAFTGFVALDHQEEESWRTVLEMGDSFNVSNDVLLAKAEHHFKILANGAHPDKPGGSHEAMQRLIKARDDARRELK